MKCVIEGTPQFLCQEKSGMSSMFWISSDTCGSWQNWLIYVPTFRNIPTSNVPVGINWCQPFLRTTGRQFHPVPFQGAVWKMYHLNPPHKPLTKLTKQPNCSASWFCLVRTYSVSKCGLKAGDYGGDVFRSLVTTERWTSWSCGLKEEAIQVFCHQLRLFLVCESGSRKISGFAILCKSLSLSLSHSIAILCKCDQVWLMVFLGCHNVSQTSGFGGQKSQSKHQKKKRFQKIEGDVFPMSIPDGPPPKKQWFALKLVPPEPITWRVRLQLCGRYPILCTVFSFILSKYLATVVPTIHHESKAKKWPPRLGVDQCLRWK